MNVYEVGMVSDKQKIEAPSAGAAAMYYGLFCVNTNNPFMVAVYTENGKEWEGEAFWMSFNPDEAHIEMVAKKVAAQLGNCRIVEDVPSDGSRKIKDVTRAAKTYTASQLCGDWWWTEKYQCRVVGGRAVYQEATGARGYNSVLLTSIKDTGKGLRTVRRYVHPDTPMELVPIESQETED